MRTTDVRFWDPRKHPGRKSGSYEVRWVVAGKVRSRSRRTKELAESFLSELRQAARRGELFDIDTGLPESMLPADPTTTWLDFAQRYVDMKWPRAAAKSRDSMTDALATVTPALVDGTAGAPDRLVLRRALRQYLLPPPARMIERPPEIQDAVVWLGRSSLPVSELTDKQHLRAALELLCLTLVGAPAAPTTARRKRAVFYNALEYAVERQELSTNVLGDLRWRAPKPSEVLDRRVVVNPRQAHELLTAATYVGALDRGRHLSTFFSVLYYAGLRPAEAKSLRLMDCELPSAGWGCFNLARSSPESNRRWTDSGVAHEERGLKHRSAADVRRVPIPPELVQMLRQHIEEFGTAQDGRLFHTRRGGVIGKAYSDAFGAARTLAFTPAQVLSPLADRPYALRHAAVSLWLNAGVPAPEVAERAGHSVEVLLRVYAKCLDGGEATSNGRITDALSAV